MSCDFVDNYDRFNTKIEKRSTNFKYAFQWNIENVSLLVPGKVIRSPVFSPMPNQRWQEQLKFDELGPFLIMIEVLPTKTEVETPAHFHITLADLNGEIIFEEAKDLMILNCIDMEYIVLSFDNFKELFSLKADTLVVKTRIEFFEFDVSTGVTELDLVPVKPTDVLRNFISDFSKMLEDSIDTDVILKVQNKELKVHKAVLRARSATFYKMFEHKSHERDRNIVDIEEVSYSIMKEFINFLYTGELKNYNYDTTFELYYVAVKYEVLDLLKLCRNALLTYASLDNILNLLLLGEVHGDEYLMARAKIFAESISKDILRTDKWETFLEEEPKLANELIDLFSINRD